MAEYTQTPHGGFAPHQHPEYGVASAGALSKFTNLTGAVVSLALIVGVGIWGYKLVVRDVSGIPVVRAAAGEMRIRPENPGGQFAQHQGLSVNTITAIGSSDARADELHLAPRPTDLAEEDQPMLLNEELTEAAADMQTPAEMPAAQDIAAALESGSVEDLVAQLTNGIAPMEALEEDAVPVLASVAAAQVAPENVPALLNGEGVRISLRPALRPKRVARVEPSVVDVNATDVDAASLPAGTRLVQLGAFDSPEIARAQWGKLNARFAPFMEGKKRIVMEAKSGGRTFFRLRAQGFVDIGDARRFCSALVAESVDCIPVVTR